MKTALNRLKALEAELTPKQVVCRFLDWMADFNDLDSFIVWAYTDEHLAWMVEIRENMYKAAKRRNSNKDVYQVSRQTHREFSFLYELAMTPCKEADAEKYRYLYSVSTMAHWMGGLWRRYKESRDMTQVVEDLNQFKLVAEGLLPELYSEQLVVKAISQRYFDNRPLLFKSQRKLYEHLVSHTEQQIEHFNEAVEVLQKLESIEGMQALSIEVESLRAIAEAKTPELVKRIEQNARIQIYESDGRHEDALKLFQRVILG